MLRRLTASPMALGLAAILAILGWYVLTINANYGGNWTALFCSGRLFPIPPELERSTYRFENSMGYDGQLYRIVAHDPGLTRGLMVYSDNPGIRWRRILVPAIAWAMALGNREYIDTTYILTILLFCGIGVYALGRWLERRDRNPMGGLLFLLLPGTLVSIDRMTVDVALYSLLFLCLLWDEERKDIPLWIALCACAFTRDLGFLVIGAFFLAEVAAQRFRRAVWILSAAIPVFAWYLHVRVMLSGLSPGKLTPEVATWAFAQSGYGILLRMFSPTQYDLTGFKRMLALVLDQVALIALIACVFLTFAYFRWRTATKLEWVGLAFAALFFVANTETLWRDLFSWTRAYTPLLAALAFTDRIGFQRWCWIPLMAVLPRVLLQFGGQLEGIVSAVRK